MIPAKRVWAVVVLTIITSLSGCISMSSQTRNSSSLVDFLYPEGRTPPLQNAIPELRVPLRVGLAFLPSQSNGRAPVLESARKEQLLERIREKFSSRKFVTEIVIIPDYYLGTRRGYEGLEGVQRLYNCDLMAIVSYDQVTYLDDNKLSLGYLTIVGAYVLKGTSRDVTTLVDLAVVDPATRSLVIRAGGTDTRQDSSTLVDAERDSRRAVWRSFSAATDQMITNFDSALVKFESDVRAGKANVRVVRQSSRGGGGGGAMEAGWLGLLGVLLWLRARQWRPGRV